MARPLHVVVSGPAGSGKTTVATALAARHGWLYLEADDLHPAANVDKMRSGYPLTDADRMPWLKAIQAAMDVRAAQKETVIVACSALRRPYRDVLRAGLGGAFIVQLVTDESTLNARVADRAGHFMPAALVHSQVATLELLDSDEDGVVVPTDGSIDVVIERVEAAIDAIGT